MDVVSSVEKFIKEKIPAQHTLKHHHRTRDFLLILSPGVSIEAQIAALTHDIERQYPYKIPDPKIFSDKKYLTKHGKASARIVGNFLKFLGAKIDQKRVKQLISNHEVGGDEESNLIRDADSLSFLENTVEAFTKKFSKEECQQKFAYMYDRIENPKAKKLGKPLYNKALKLLK
jgi:hypothetical protein